MIYSAAGKKHLMRLAEMPCMFCFVEPCGEPHHIRTGTNGGMGKKPSDKYAINTCHKCHTEIHTKGEKTFYKKHGYDIEEMIDYALSLWRRNNGTENTQQRVLD